MRRHFLKAFLLFPVFLAGCAGAGSGSPQANTGIPEQTDTLGQSIDDEVNQSQQEDQDISNSVQQFEDDTDNDIANQEEQQQEEDDQSEQDQDDDDQ